MVGIA
jgi:hypothetical protein